MQQTDLSALDCGGDAHPAIASAKIRCSLGAQEGPMIVRKVRGAIGCSDRQVPHRCRRHRCGK
jgi:hypothetical protein